MKKPLIFAAAASFVVPSLRAADDTVYTAVVEKIFNASCVGCHRPEKKKGKLDMSTYENLMKGGESQAKGKMTVKAGKADESLLIKLISLPKDDDDHMPPGDSKAPQLNQKEVEVLKWWVNEGAKKDSKLAEAKVPDAIKATVDELSKKKVSPPPVEKKK